MPCMYVLQIISVTNCGFKTVGILTLLSSAKRISFITVSVVNYLSKFWRKFYVLLSITNINHSFFFSVNCFWSIYFDIKATIHNQKITC